MRSLSVAVVFIGVVVALVAGLALPSQRKAYHGHTVLKINVDSEAHVKALRSLEDVHGLLVDFWLSPKKLPGMAHIRIAPEQKDKVMSVLGEAGMKHDIMVEDLQSLIEKETQSLAKRRVFKAGDHPSFITTNEYHNLQEIHAYLDSVATTYPNTTTVSTIGKSFMNEDLKYIRIGSGSKPKPKASFINGCIHAREWLGCATMVYIINELTANSDQYQDILKDMDVYVLPVLNPDGYKYTWETDRMWRKTRSGPRNGCYGVDPNRNWDFKWGVAGSSSNPCSETYDGPNANSEQEVQHITTFLGKNNNTIRAYFDIHTYSEDFMYPFGYAEVYPADCEKIRDLAGKATKAVNSANGEAFTYGSITDIVYPASGSSIDYTKGLLNIDYSYAMELRPDGNAWNGFVLPESQILPGAAECWAGVQVVFKQAASES